MSLWGKARTRASPRWGGVRGEDTASRARAVDTMLSDLGEMPSAARPSERSLWVASLINPPGCREWPVTDIRAAILTATTPLERLSVAKRVDTHARALARCCTHARTHAQTHRVAQVERGTAGASARSLRHCTVPKGTRSLSCCMQCSNALAGCVLLVGSLLSWPCRVMNERLCSCTCL